MAGALRKTMVYLGLAEDQGRYDDEYDEGYDEHVEHVEEPRAPRCRGDATCRRGSRGAGRALARRPSGISRITTIHPRTYNEAKTIGENFRDGIPVIMNLTDMSDADAKRLVDFAAGLVFGLRGSIERVTAKVFLLSPETVEVNAEEGRGRRPAAPCSTRADDPRPATQPRRSHCRHECRARDVLQFVIFLYFLVLFGRVVLDWIRVFARDWRPRGVVLRRRRADLHADRSAAQALRKVIPPLRLGGASIDLFRALLRRLVLLILSDGFGCEPIRAVRLRSAEHTCHGSPGSRS